MSYSQVLVTRPEPECSNLAQTLQVSGLTAIKMPAFKFSARAVPTGVVTWSAEPRMAIFTSPRAVEFGVKPLMQAAPEDLIVAAMGEATAQALQRQGLDVDLMPEGGVDSEAMLKNRVFNSNAGSAVIFAAPGGRDTLRDGLQVNGWTVNVAHVYERELVNPQPDDVRRLEGAGPCVSIWTSGAAMEFMQEKLQGRAWDNILAGVMIVISPRLNRCAEKMGASDVRIATGPGNEELSQCALAASG